MSSLKPHAKRLTQSAIESPYPKEEQWDQLTRKSEYCLFPLLKSGVLGWPKDKLSIRHYATYWSILREWVAKPPKIHDDAHSRKHQNIIIIIKYFIFNHAISIVISFFADIQCQKIFGTYFDQLPGIVEETSGRKSISAILLQMFIEWYSKLIFSRLRFFIDHRSLNIPMLVFNDKAKIRKYQRQKSDR